jgi:hypothetical protein
MEKISQLHLRGYLLVLPTTSITQRCNEKLADYLIETSDRCIRIASHGRQLVDELDASIRMQENEPLSRVSANGRELANELDAIGRDLLAKAVELDTERQKNSPGTFGP